MSVKGKEKEIKQSNNYSLYCGFAEIKEILAINPSVEEKAKLYGFELEKGEDVEEIEYTSVNEETGNQKVILDVYMECHKDGIAPIRHRIFMEDTELSFEDDNTKEIKYKFVNQVGQLATAKSENELPVWFTYFQVWNDDEKKFEPTEFKKNYRKCLKGEDKLMIFVRECLSKIDYDKDPDSEIGYNYKKLFNGDVKELLGDLKGNMFNPFTVMVQVATSADGGKSFQELYMPNNNFKVPTLGIGIMKYINLGSFPNGYLKKNWKKYCEQIDGQYGAKGFAPKEEIREYKGDQEDIAVSKTAKADISPTNANY